MGKLPKRRDIATTSPLTINIDIPTIVSNERSALESAIAAGDLRIVIARYPVRETPALGIVATTLGFQGRSQYESAVRQLLIDDAQTLSFVRGLFNALARDIEAA
jgi:hypothetical protein